MEGKYYVYGYDELKNIKNLDEFFDIRPEGNWEGKIILDELKEPNEQIIKQLLEMDGYVIKVSYGRNYNSLKYI